MNGYNQYNNGYGSSGTARVVELDERLWQYVSVKAGYYKAKYYKMKRSDNSLSWNGSAFMVPVQWLAYRKMYLQAVIVWVISRVMDFVYLMANRRVARNFIDELGLSLGDLYELLTLPQEEAEVWLQSHIDPAYLDIDAAASLVQNMLHQMLICLAVFLVVWMLLHLVFGLLGNAIYMNRVEKLVQSESGLSKTLVPLQREKQGGVSNAAVVISLIATVVIYLVAGI